MCVKSWFGKADNVSEFNLFINAIKSELYYRAFPLVIECFRKFGDYEISPEAYTQLSDLMMIVLTESGLKYDVSTPSTLMNMANTYFMKEQPEGNHTYLRA